LVAASIVSGLFGLVVMRTIDFNHDPTSETDKVGEIAQQRRLSPEVEALCSKRAQPHP
jgi:hypothetical protein